MGATGAGAGGGATAAGGGAGASVGAGGGGATVGSGVCGGVVGSGVVSTGGSDVGAGKSLGAVVVCGVVVAERTAVFVGDGRGSGNAATSSARSSGITSKMKGAAEARRRRSVTAGRTIRSVGASGEANRGRIGTTTAAALRVAASRAAASRAAA